MYGTGMNLPFKNLDNEGMGVYTLLQLQFTD